MRMAGRLARGERQLHPVTHDTGRDGRGEGEKERKPHQKTCNKLGRSKLGGSKAGGSKVGRSEVRGSKLGRSKLGGIKLGEKEVRIKLRQE